jgi:dTDP-L-rhamnose 4-epimerase
MQRILITGGAGFIGRSLALALTATGRFDVTVLDSLSPQVHGASADFDRELAGAVRCLRGDVRSREDVRVALAGQEIVVHLAAETGTGQSMYEASRYVDVNVTGTAVLLESSADPGAAVRKVVLASSRAVYGEGQHACESCGTVTPGPRRSCDMAKGMFEPRCPQCGRRVSPVPTREEASLRPVSVYGATKLAQEQLVQVYGWSRGIETVALRFQNVYGPGQSPRNPYTGVLSIFSGLIRQGRAIEIYEDGDEARDFVYIDDAVAALCLAVETDGLPGTVYNVGTGVPTTIRDVVEGLTAVSGLPVESTVSGRFRPGDIRWCVAAVERGASELGFTADRSFESGLQGYWSWIEAQDESIEGLGRSISELERHGLMRGGSS